MNQNTQSLSLRQELAWFIVERMNDAVGFEEAYEEVGEYLKIIEKRIDEMIKECHDKHEHYPVGTQYWINCLKNVKEMLLK